MDANPKLLVQVRNKLRTNHYSYRTEQQYLAWIRRFNLYHGKRHPREMSGAEVEPFRPSCFFTGRCSRLNCHGSQYAYWLQYATISDPIFSPGTHARIL